jgi:hypothetical protein
MSHCCLNFFKLLKLESENLNRRLLYIFNENGIMHYRFYFLWYFKVGFFKFCVHHVEEIGNAATGHSTSCWKTVEFLFENVINRYSWIDILACKGRYSYSLYQTVAHSSPHKNHRVLCVNHWILQIATVATYVQNCSSYIIHLISYISQQIRIYARYKGSTVVYEYGTITGIVQCYCLQYTEKIKNSYNVHHKLIGPTHLFGEEIYRARKKHG